VVHADAEAPDEPENWPAGQVVQLPAEIVEDPVLYCPPGQPGTSQHAWLPKELYFPAGHDLHEQVNDAPHEAGVFAK
jgi:hypothetical protein